MKKKHLYRTARKLTSILMAAILVCLAPLSDFQMESAYAAGQSDADIAAENAAWETDGEELSYSPLVGELTDERTQNTKTFLREDGAKEVVLYSYAVHYEDDGQWKDIDNSLYPVTMEDGSTAYTNTANDYQVWFSEGSEGERLVRIEKDGYSISWTIPAMEPSADTLVSEGSLGEGLVAAYDSLLSTPGDLSAGVRSRTVGMTDEERDEVFRFPSTYLSEITYENAVNGLDVRYVVRPQMIEEFFEASTAAAAASLSEVEIIISCEGVTAGQNADGSVSFVNEAGEQVFSLGQPYMSDAAGEVSPDIGVSLTVVEDTVETAAGEIGASVEGQAGESEDTDLSALGEAEDQPSEESDAEDKVQYIYRLSPSSDWLESGDRTYPVSVDPNIYTSIACENISDTHIHQSTPDYAHGAEPSKLRLGTHWENDNYRMLLRFEQLPAIGTDDVVVSADLRLTRFWNSSVNDSTDYGDVIEVYRVTESWEEATVTWNNQPDCDTQVEAIDIGRDYDAEGRDQYNLFDLTRLVKEWYAGTPNYGIMIRVHDETALNYYEYMSSEVDYSTEEHPYLSIVYVSSSGLESMWSYHSQSAGRAGAGYVNDYTGGLTLVHDTVSVEGGALPISISHVYNSGSRDTDVGFGKGWRLSIMEEVAAVSISGVTWYRYLDGDGTEHYYYPSGTSGVYLDEMDSKNKLTVGSGSFSLTDSSFITRTFDSNGRLVTISDPNGNTQTIAYNGSLPVTVTDSAGRTATLYYGGSQLTAIQYPDGIQATCYYTSDGQLSHIKDADGGFGYYAYFEDSMVLVDTQGYQLWYYFDTSTWRVKSIQSITQGTNIEGPSLSVEYGWNVTAYTDNQGRTELVRFNNQGEPISVQDASGRAAYGNYSGEDGMKSKLVSLSEMQKTSVNLLNNGNVTSTSNWTVYSSGLASGSSNGRSTSNGFMNSDSLYMTKASGTGVLGYGQTMSVTAGKTYTFSAYLKGAEGAKIAIQTGSSWSDAVSQAALISADEWMRTSVTYTVPSGVSQIRVAVYLPAGVSGTVYADCLQLEEGELSRYNLLSNSDFTSGTASWTASNKESGDGVGTIPSGGTHPSSLSTSGYYLSGDPSLDKYVSQTVNISGSKGDSFVFGGWLKAASVPELEDEGYGTYGLRQLKVVFMNGTSQVGETTADFSADTIDWQYLCSSATAPEAYTSIIFRFAYTRNCNTAWFDGLQLYKEGFGERYTYTNGNLTQVVDKEDKKTDYEYDSNNNVTKATDKYGDTVTYTYDSRHNVLTATALGTTTEYTYDSKGNVTATKVYGSGSSGTYLKSSSAYSSNGAFMTGLTDALGNTASYSYNTLQGSIATAADPLGNSTSYGYDSIHRLSSVTAKNSAGTSVASVTYAYSGDYLSSITRNGMSYSLVTDTFGNTTSVSAAGSTLVTNTYDYLHALLTKTTYGNGYTLNYEYDEYDRLKAVKEGTTSIYTAYYDGDGRLYRSTDGKTGITTQYDYDLSGKLVRAANSDGSSYRYIYDGKDNLTGIRQTANGRTWTTTYGYDSQYRPTTTVIGNSSGGTAATITNTYDTLSRLTKQTYALSSSYAVTLGYATGANGSQSTQLSSYRNGSESAYQYTYDKNGNIKTITQNGKTVTYTYDALQQLTREDNQFLNKSIAYTYDTGGNLTSKKEYAYTTGTLGTATATISYNYGNSWKDQLTSYNGQSISYDAIGNPTTYRGWTFGWSGRNLTSISKSGTTGTYTYNNDGLRTGKTVNGYATTYTYQGSLLMAEQRVGTVLYYSYDSSGKVVSVNYNGTEYYYLRNGQGDIVGLLDGSGTKVVSYSYDSWGKVTATEGTLASTLGADNPFRYRGYYYDGETGYYWLTSRYYDPEVGRFINADNVISSAGEDILGYNMYAYCFNNPVNMSDPSGNWPTWGQVFSAVTTVIVATIVAAAVVAAAPAVAGAVFSTAAYYGASIATAKVLATVTTIGCAGVAGGISLIGLNEAVESVTGTNYAAKAIGQTNYDNLETAVNLAAAAIVTVPQTNPYPSTGRSEPQNLNEQVGMNLAKANADAGEVIIKSLNDPRMPGWLGWQKYQINYPGTGINIHYVGNKFIPIFFDFKFKE